jgi:hypothetical protein
MIASKAIRRTIVAFVYTQGTTIEAFTHSDGILLERGGGGFT